MQTSSMPKPMTLTTSVVPPTGLHRVVSVIQLSLLVCQLSFIRPSSASASLSRQSVLLPLHATPCVPLASPVPLASARLLPFLQVSSRASSPSALCHELRVQKLRPVLFLKLLAFDPSYCPPFFCWFIFPDQEPFLPFSPEPPFVVSKAPLLCQDQVLLAGVGAAAPGILCACAVPAQQVEQQNGDSSTRAFISFPWGGEV